MGSRAPSEVFRVRRDKLYDVLNTSKPTLVSLTEKAYAKGIIDRNIKIYIVENLSANILLDHIEMGVDLCPDLQTTVFEIMGDQEYLQSTVDEMKFEIQRNVVQDRQHKGKYHLS